MKQKSPRADLRERKCSSTPKWRLPLAKFRDEASKDILPIDLKGCLFLYSSVCDKKARGKERTGQWQIWLLLKGGMSNAIPLILWKLIALSLLQTKKNAQQELFFLFVYPNYPFSIVWRKSFEIWSNNDLKILIGVLIRRVCRGVCSDSEIGISKGDICFIYTQMILKAKKEKF